MQLKYQQLYLLLPYSSSSISAYQGLIILLQQVNHYCIIIQYILLIDIITHCYWSQVQCDTDIYRLQSVALPGTTINLIILSFVRLLLLLLSGDVELNPGPTVEEG